MTQKLPSITIIGAGLTGLTTGFYLKKAGFPVTIIEKSEHIGGVIRSIHKNGFLYEKGPNTGVIGNVELLQLFQNLKGKIEPTIADADAKKRLILKNNRWEPLPSGLMSAIRTPLFTWYDKCRILGEPFRKKGTDPDETLADMVRRRMGKSFLSYAVDPFISGIYTGDPETLIPRLALPKLYNLEQDYGSFIRGAIKKSREPKTPLEKQVTKDVFSVKGGLQVLTTALADEIGRDCILTGTTISDLTPEAHQYRIKYSNKDTNDDSMKTTMVISTVAAEEFLTFAPFISHTQQQFLTDLRYAKITQVSVGFNTWDGMDIKAFGGLIPTVEHKDILGILFPSSFFKGRAPEGGALFSFFIGGIKKPELFDLSDDDISALVTRELKNLLHTTQTPDLFEISRYPRAIPQYEISSNKRLETIDAIENTYPGLILAGNIRNGIGISDRVKQAHDIAHSIINAHL